MPVEQDERVPGAPRPRPDASMSWLTDLMTTTLDRGYADATRRREERGDPRAGRLRPSVLLFVGLAVVGLVLATAAVQVRARAGGAETTRSALLAELAERTEQSDALSARLEEAQTELARIREETLALTGDGPSLTEELRGLEALAGAVPVEGEGVIVTVDDAPTAATDASGDPRVVEESSGRVLDTDLQRVVNGLWQAGAEAVAVNGQRLTSRTAIREAGAAILVDYRPLSPPYTVEAVGDRAALEEAVRSGPVGELLDVLAETYGIVWSVGSSEELVLPASAGTTLHHATPAPEAELDGRAADEPEDRRGDQRGDEHGDRPAEEGAA